jgi:CubicO group peptidase (beta-lactamase class C family)
MAVGYGTQQVGALNNPRHWGPASWLVMGSGGMVSTPGDMHKWLKALFSGDYLSSEAITRYRLGQVLAGGSDRGFLMMYRDDPNQTAIISSNAHQEQGDRASTVARALMRIVHPEF